MPESERQLSAHEIEDAYRAFQHAAGELARASSNAWTNRLRTLVHVGRTTPVLRDVLQPLRESDLDPEAWWVARTKGPQWAVHGGSDPLDLPPEPERAAALMLKLMEAFVDEQVPFHNAMMGLVGVKGGNFDARARRMSEELLSPLAGFVETRLRAIHRAAQPPSVPAQAGGIGAYIAGDAIIHGGAFVAGSGNTVDQSSRTITYAATTDLGQAITAWREALSEVETHRHAEIIAAIEALARAADGEPRRPVELVQAAQTLVDATPTLRARIADVVRRWGAKGVAAAAGGAAGALGKEAVTELLAHQDQVINALRLVLGAGA